MYNIYPSIIINVGSLWKTDLWNQEYKNNYYFPNTDKNLLKLIFSISSNLYNI